MILLVRVKEMGRLKLKRISWRRFFINKFMLYMFLGFGNEWVKVVFYFIIIDKRIFINMW